MKYQKYVIEFEKKNSGHHHFSDDYDKKGRQFFQGCGIVNNILLLCRRRDGDD